MKQPAAAGPSGSEACVQLLSSRSQWGASWREWWSPCPWQSWTWWGWCRSTGSWQDPLLQWDQPGQLQREQRSDHRSSHLPLELAPPSPAPWCACLLALGPTGSEHRACHRPKLAMPWTPQPLLPQLPATQPEHPAGQERKLRAKQRVPPRLPPGQGTLPSTTGPWLKLDFWLFDVLSPKPSWRCKIWATQAYHRTNWFPTLFTSLYWYQAKAKFSQPSFVTSDSKASVHWHTCNRSGPSKPSNTWTLDIYGEKLKGPEHRMRPNEIDRMTIACTLLPREEHVPPVSLHRPRFFFHFLFWPSEVLSSQTKSQWAAQTSFLHMTLFLWSQALTPYNACTADGSSA